MGTIKKNVELSKASQGTRFLNLIIDRIIVYALFMIVGLFIGVFAELFDSDVLRDFIFDLSNINKYADILLTTCVYCIYLFCMEYFANGRTIGKFITGTQVINVNGMKPNASEVFLRTVSRLVPFDAFSFLGENGWHDTWSDTRVVNVSKYKDLETRTKEIEEIGFKENS
jgi:uncharacterized RDD family membrane protein YckC